MPLTVTTPNPYQIAKGWWNATVGSKDAKSPLILERWAVAVVARAFELLQVRAGVALVHEQSVACVPPEASGCRAAIAITEV